MTVHRAKFDPEVLLSAPRRSACVPNPAGTLLAYTQSTYSFESHSSHTELIVLDLSSKKTRVLTNSYSGSPQWLDDNQLIWLKEESNGNTSFIVAEVSGDSKPYVAGVTPGTVSNLKVTKLSEDHCAFAVSGKANSDGTLFNPSNVKKPVSSGKIYTSLFVRHWDEYTQDEKQTIWIGTLHKSSLSGPESSQYSVSGLKNVFKLFNLPHRVESPILPFGGSDHFDICPKGVVFVSKDPTLNDALHTKCVCYVCPIPFAALAESVNPMEAKTITAKSLEGALTSPVISPVNNTLAFLAMREDGYESDKNRVVIAKGVFDKGSETIELFASEDNKGAWDRSPSSLLWAHDDSSLIIKAEDTGRGLVFQVPMGDAKVLTTANLLNISSTGSVVDVASTPKGLFLTSSSLVESSLYSLVEAKHQGETKEISSATNNGSSFGLSPSQVSETWWKGANDHPVHAWVIKPSNFKPGGKYPLAFLVHGGPQGAWNDQWSTRWNPLIFAEQGYVVVTPNPTGSTGYGQGFTDAIRGSWGGLPYEDLVKCFEHIENNLTFVDTDRAVALGASYGGFMMNWIQGHELGRKFKALVTHDGIFSTKFSLAAEELYFPIHDLNGIYWKNPESWIKWDPSEFINEWKTPHLVIHSERDYRLTIAEGLALFNALQLRGVESALLTFPDENHWVIKPENSLLWHRAVINWINKYAGLPLWLDKEGNNCFPQDLTPMK
ncbi:Prolyl oligopeptidase [Trichophyton interdigitale]|uniref:Dipeptidyl-peptidase V n=1 Tax=Trichophyton interdigitale TaxID=101480 RepID=A0A9P4YLX7_9EURO|nr:Prolyl oligopeptidase [Trichophyton interdigitale]KAF3900231.1 Prolyl oligopeptidase [Trichophyton interdigitale]KAG8212617.1 Prolyl oligopeptidase [Trichophyton interdigitale]